MSQNTSKCKSGMYIWIYVCVNVIHVWHVLEYTVEVFVCFWSPGWAFNFGEHRGTLHGNLYMFRVLVVNYDKTISISGCSSLVKGLFRKKTASFWLFAPSSLVLKRPQTTLRFPAAKHAVWCGLSFMPCSLSHFQFRFHASCTVLFTSPKRLHSILLCLCMLMHVN